MPPDCLGDVATQHERLAALIAVLQALGVLLIVWTRKRSNGH